MEPTLEPGWMKYSDRAEYRGTLIRDGQSFVVGVITEFARDHVEIVSSDTVLDSPIVL